MAVDLDLAKRLKTYRNFKHLTQKDVAAHLNGPHSAISDIENGKRGINPKYFERFEEVFKEKNYSRLNLIKCKFHYCILDAEKQ